MTADSPRTSARAYIDPRVYADELTALHDSVWQLFGLMDELLEGVALRRRILAFDVTLVRRADELRATTRVGDVRVACIDRLVFVAFVDGLPPLRDYLGPYASVLAATSSQLGRVIYDETEIARANWKHCVEISLDDYHAASVHPTTFGSGASMLTDQFVYQRHGQHSCYLKRRDVTWQFDGFWRDAEAGRFDQTGYKIFNVFPNALFASMGAMYVATVFTPLDPGRTALRTWILDWADRPLAETDAPGLIEYGRTFLREDREVCEGLQEAIELNADRVGIHVLGRLEQRISWFQESYAKMMMGKTR